MRTKSRLFIELVLVVAAFSWTSAAQSGNTTTESGLKPFGSYHGGDIDTISLVNGKLDLHAPLVSWPQRGKLGFGFTIRYLDPSYEEDRDIPGTCGTPGNPCTYWSTFDGGGVVVVPDFNYGIYQETKIVNNVANNTYSIVSPDGGSHVLIGSETGDATGLHWDSTNNIITDREGVRYYTGANNYSYFPGAFPLPVNKVEDTNGNQITVGSSTYTDTLGRVIPKTYTVTTDYSNCSGPLPISSASTWTVPGPQGGQVTYKFCYVTFSLNFNLVPGQYHYPETSAVTMLQSIVLPNLTAWTFEYNTAWGILTKITLPTGGSISYGASAYRNCGNATYPYMYNTKYASRTVDANDGNGGHQWTYTFPNPFSYTTSYTVNVTDPLGNVAAHTISNLGQGCPAYETMAQYYLGPVSSQNLVKTVTTDYTSSAYSFLYYSGIVNVVPIRTTTTWQLPGGATKVTKTEKDYDTGFSANGYTGLHYGNVVAERVFDYGSSTPGPILRYTHTGYQAFSNSSYLTYNILDAVSSVEVNDTTSGWVCSNGRPHCAYTYYGYDESTRQSSGIPTQHNASPINGSIRGNQTSVHRWLNTTAGYLNSTNVFYDTGKVYTSTDPLGNITTYTYDPAFVGAYLTKTQLPDTNSPNLAHHIVQDSYDFNTGLRTSHTDENSNTTSYTYDNMWRVLTATQPAPAGAITYAYNDTPGNLYAEASQVMSGSQSTAAYTLFDGLGREIAHSTANGQSSYDKSDICYGARGLKFFTAYPYTASSYNAPQVCSGAGDTFSYDALNRLLLVTHSDSTAINYGYSGAATSVTDEGNGTRSVQKISQVDGLGRLKSVCEVASADLTVGTDKTRVSCGQDIAGTGFLTTYGYDGLSNLTSVAQGSALNQRTFTYDSLSRLVTTTNPEAGTTCFGTWAGSTCTENYDANSNVLSRTRPAPNQTSWTTYVTATFTYDPLNRLRTKTYSDGTTPSVTLNYDETSVSGNSISNTSGRLSSEYTGSSSAMSSQSILSYAAPGWVATDIQCTPLNCGTRTFSFAYTYDGAGNVTGSSNGNGVTYALSYNTAPRLTQITTNHVSSTVGSGTFISGLQYNAFGEPVSSTLYNGIGESWTYDARGRLSSYSAAVGASTKYSLSNLTYSGNSNVRSATDSVNGTWSSYTYDDFNRLVTSTCTATCPSSQSSLAFSYVYDRYGNRWQQNVTAGSGPQPQYSFDVNNRITASVYTYDAAGNVINDGTHSYTYDAENRIVKVDGGSTALYSYDAEGRRVAKSDWTTGKQYEYLFDGAQAITELQSGTATTIRSEVYASGRHLVTQNVSLGTSYFIHTDWLGTERARTSLSGSVVETCTSLAYGDSLTCTGTDVSPLHFTGKMRDNETGLDEFPARYYSSGLGRWYSPDWASAQVPVPYADLYSPQTLNLYDYVGSDPTNHADADGHFLLWSEGSYMSELSGQDERNRESAAAGQADDSRAQNKPDPTAPPAPPTPDPAGVRTDPALDPNSAKTSSGRTPASGPPDTTVNLPGDKPGTGTDRTYGPDGRAVKDVDTGHDHGAGDPHAHDWDWSKARPRQPGRPLTPEEQAALKKTAVWGTVGVVTYWVVSEGSRILFPPRNLVPIP